MIPTIPVICSTIYPILVKLWTKKHENLPIFDAHLSPIKSEKRAKFNDIYLGNPALFCDTVCSLGCLRRAITRPRLHTRLKSSRRAIFHSPRMVNHSPKFNGKGCDHSPKI